MKIEIDLNEILGTENGCETLQESVRRQVIEELVCSTKKSINTQIKTAVAETIEATLSSELKRLMPALLDDILNTEYTPVDRFGSKSPPTTFRSQLLSSIQEEMKYDNRKTYDSNKNAFTKAVNAVIEEHLAAFKKEFSQNLTSEVSKQAMQYALTELLKRVGVPK